MAVKIGYEGERMVISGIACDCGLPHGVPTQDIYVGQGLLRKVPEYIRRRGLGSRAVLVCDDNTHRIAGGEVLSALRGAGFEVALCRLSREGKLVPDERAVGEALLALSRDTEFLISVGSGSVTDVARAVAVNAKLPFVAVGTAPSMDGYTSVVAPLILRGAKIHRPANCPEIIVCDLDIMRQAPAEMFISGVGDVLGKYIAKADWVLGSIVNDEVYCPVCGGIVLDAVDRLVENVDEIRRRTVLGTRILIEALLLAGLTIMIAGHTRAVASVEHNLVHYWDMMRLREGLPEPTHGTAVGISTLLVWPLYERFARQRMDGAIERALGAKRKTAAEREAWMIDMYGENIAREIMRENPEDFLTAAELERRVRRAVGRIDDIRAELARLPGLERVRGTMEALGAPMTPGEIGIDGETLSHSLRCGKDYRSRYSLFKLLDELDLLEEYLR